MRKLIQAATVAIMLLPVAGVAQDRNAICKSLSSDLVEKLSAPPVEQDYRLYKVDSFYSEKLDTCIHVEVSLFGPQVTVRDLTGTVIKPNSYYPQLLLHCDVAGVDEANIEAVRRYRGDVMSVPFREWLSDGQGGLPRALKTPDEPFDRAACENALERWLKKWGS